MKRAIIVLSILFASATYAQELPEEPDFILCQDHGRLRMVSQSTDELTYSLDKYFPWEGSSSHFKISRLPDVTIEWKMDIIGPDWVYITLSQTTSGLFVSERRTNSNGDTVTEIDAKLFKDYHELEHSDHILAQAVITLLGRVHVNPRLCELRAMQDLLFINPTINRSVDQECIQLISELGSEDFYERRAATDTLSDLRFVTQLDRIVKDLNLTCEQRARVRMVQDMYLPNASSEALAALAKIEE